MLEDFSDDILIFYEGNAPHSPLALWAFKRVDLIYFLNQPSRRINCAQFFSKCHICDFRFPDTGNLIIGICFFPFSAPHISIVTIITICSPLPGTWLHIANQILAAITMKLDVLSLWCFFLGKDLTCYAALRLFFRLNSFCWRKWPKICMFRANTDNAT